MFIALSNLAMRLSELIILYLATAAPFGVAGYFCQPTHIARPRALLNAVCAALLWPLALLARTTLMRKSLNRPLPNATTQKVVLPRERQIDNAQRALLCVLYRMEDFAREAFGLEGESLRQTTRETIASVERHVGLTLAVAEIKQDAPPSPREIELCRLAGREGEDLFVAGRCLQRRHTARLKAHQAASRLALLHALAALREGMPGAQTGRIIDFIAARSLFAALLEAYARAIDLLSLLEDERATMSVARLLDAACASLRDVETLCAQDAPKSFIQPGSLADSVGDNSCLISIQQSNQHLLPSNSQTSRTHG